VRQNLRLSVGVSLCLVFAIAWTRAQPAPPVDAGMASIDEVLKAVREDLQDNRAGILGKNITLTREQALTFWPLFASYQREQNAIMDDQLRGIQRYIENFETLDDAGALGLITAHFDRDTRMTALRQRWLGEFRKVLGVKLAVRVMQIDRRLSLAHQIQFTAKIPLAH